MNLDKFVGSRLRRLRHQQQIDRRRFAELLGADPETYAAYETGAQPLSAKTLFELACHFDVQVTYFFEGFEGEGGRTLPQLRKRVTPKR